MLSGFRGALGNWQYHTGPNWSNSVPFCLHCLSTQTVLYIFRQNFEKVLCKDFPIKSYEQQWFFQESESSQKLRSSSVLSFCRRFISPFPLANPGTQRFIEVGFTAGFPAVQRQSINALLIAGDCVCKICKPGKNQWNMCSSPLA